VRQRSFASTLVDDATIRYRPVGPLELRAGYFRIPFTLENASPYTALLFPTRAAVNEVFLSGADWGALAIVRAGAWAQASAGAFRGESLGFQPRRGFIKGLALAGRVDVQPLGAFAPEESLVRGPPRLGLGAGLIYTPATQYDTYGNAQTPIDDWRLSLTVRLQAYGASLVGEFLRFWRFDAYSGRPQEADGFYARATVFARLRPWLAVAPLARVGLTRTDLSFDPQKVLWLESGLAVYPRAQSERPSAVRLTFQYQGEYRLTERETAHAAVAQLQLLWR
jgi:hypothetical protein